MLVNAIPNINSRMTSRKMEMQARLQSLVVNGNQGGLIPTASSRKRAKLHNPWLLITRQWPALILDLMSPLYSQQCLSDHHWLGYHLRWCIHSPLVLLAGSLLHGVLVVGWESCKSWNIWSSISLFHQYSRKEQVSVCTTMDGRTRCPW